MQKLYMVQKLNLGLKPLSVAAFELLSKESRPLILDTRSPESFAKGFIQNSINIRLDSNLAMWVEELIPDIKQENLLVTENVAEKESIICLSRVGYYCAIGYLDDGFDAWKSEGKEVDYVDRISAEEFSNHLKNGAKVFDVRKASEFASQHVKGAHNTPLGTINDYLAEYPTEEPFILHCAGGYRSMIASSILKQRVWDNFVDVVGGFDAINTDVAITDYFCPSTLL